MVLRSGFQASADKKKVIDSIIENLSSKHSSLNNSASKKSSASKRSTGSLSKKAELEEST